MLFLNALAWTAVALAVLVLFTGITRLGRIRAQYGDRAAEVFTQQAAGKMAAWVLIGIIATLWLIYGG